MPADVVEPDAPGSFSVRDAVATLNRAADYDVALRRRTEGVAWMVWGLVATIVFLLDHALDDAVEWWASVSMYVVLWPALGVLATSAAWRVAGLSRPALAPPAERTTWLSLSAFAVIALAFSASWLVYAATGAYAAMGVVVAGLPWGFLALVQWGRMSPDGRRLTLALGAVMVVAFAVAVTVLPVGGSSFGRFVAIAVVAGVPFVAGTARAFWT